MNGDDAIASLQAELRDFAAARDWEKYHTPRNLSALIASEAGELLSLFRWGEDAAETRRKEVRLEVADVLIGLLRFGDVADIDLVEAVREKITLNGAKYPVAGDRTPPAPG